MSVKSSYPESGSVSDFEVDAKWFLARGWRGVFFVVIAVIVVFVTFNSLSAIFNREMYIHAFGTELRFQPINRRVEASASWIVPLVILGVCTVLNRVVANAVMKKIASLESKKKAFDAFVYFGECLSILTLKFSGGVESPMYLYFLGHIVALSSVVTSKTLAKHIVFLSVMFALLAVSEYSGLIAHTDLTSPPIFFYRSPEYVYIITLGVIGYMTYIGVSSSNIFRKFFEREKALDMALKSKMEADLYLDLMSHDITNYNQTILGNIGLIERMKLSDGRQERYLGICKRQVEKSEKLISKVKAFAQASAIEEGDLMPVDIDSAIAEAVDKVCLDYPEKTIHVAWEEAAGRMVRGDELLVAALANVMENAVKHSKREETRIEIGVSRQPRGARKFWEIRVQDDGPGIPDELKEKIFERYTKIGWEKATGLGLALVKAVLDKYGGSVRAENRVEGSPDAGTVFIIAIPEA
ncbi:MAG: HAMP domain-containing sensor histidine kinase [bacterium]